MEVKSRHWCSEPSVASKLRIKAKVFTITYKNLLTFPVPSSLWLHLLLLVSCSHSALATILSAFLDHSSYTTAFAIAISCFWNGHLWIFTWLVLSLSKHFVNISLSQGDPFWSPYNSIIVNHPPYQHSVSPFISFLSIIMIII